MTVLMVSFSCASTLRGVISARRSKASSMMACNCGMVFPNLVLECLGEFGDTSCGFQRLVQIGDQRQADEVRAGVDSVRFAGKEAAGQHGDIIVAVQLLREGRVGDGGTQPQVEAGIRLGDRQYRGEQGDDLGELL